MANSAGAKDNQITFPAIVYKVQTLVDNGLRVTLDLPEQSILEASQLMECKRQGISLKVAIIYDNA